MPEEKRIKMIANELTENVVGLIVLTVENGLQWTKLLAVFPDGTFCTHTTYTHKH